MNNLFVLDLKRLQQIVKEENDMRIEEWRSYDKLRGVPYCPDRENSDSLASAMLLLEDVEAELTGFVTAASAADMQEAGRLTVLTHKVRRACDWLSRVKLPKGADRHWAPKLVAVSVAKRSPPN